MSTYGRGGEPPGESVAISPTPPKFKVGDQVVHTNWLRSHPYGVVLEVLPGPMYEVYWSGAGKDGQGGPYHEFEIERAP